MGGPYVILEDAKKAPILYLSCKLSDLFDEVERLHVEDFTQFAEIYTTELRGVRDIVFKYDEMTITIFCNEEDALSSDCTVIISNLVVSSECY